MQSGFAQFDNWATIDLCLFQKVRYHLNTGKYQIILDKSGNGKLIYTKASVTNEYDFKAGKKHEKA
ncbi:MAG: hypothetical protein R3A12_02995 [Ignavibacteria bacterium]